MVNKLNKPYTNKEYADFVNSYPGLIPLITDNAVYMIKQSETVINEEIVDISGTDEYLENKKKYNKIQLEAQMELLDKKRIRAFIEGGNYNDNTTWLEYYNSQIEQLRKEYNS